MKVLCDAEEKVVNRLHACVETELSLEDGKPLLLCALTDWVLVGFPKPPWDRDVVTVKFDELLPDETINNVTEK
ncbi:MAG: hypothetical protein OXC26_24570 [Albidovulum sp.]|nr:hypothetical protein [Albidovulum sp.]